MKKISRHYIITLLLCGFFSLYGNVTRAEKISVVDDDGQNVVLGSPAKRIVTLAPHITENIFAIGEGDRIVGTVEFSDYPIEAINIPRVGNYSGVSVETILALEPDLVLAWKAGTSAATLNKLRSLGIAVYVDELKSTEDITATLRVFGQLLGVQATANRIAGNFENKLVGFKSRYKSKAPVKVFYQVWHSPIQTLNNRSLIGEVITLCGGVNVFGDSPAVAPIVSVESVMGVNPELIVASGFDDEKPEWLDDWFKYRSIEAVLNKRLVHIHPDILQRHSMRILDGAEQMCQAIDRVRTAR